MPLAVATRFRAILLFFCFSGSGSVWAGGKVGIDANYALEMERQGRAWSEAGGPVEPWSGCAAAGCEMARIRLWVGDEGTNRLAYATETARRAVQAGLKPVLVIFLSEEWADFVKQPAPKIWQNLTQDQKLAAIEAYAEKVTRHFAANGVEVETFEIGNEIDFGICGEFEEEWPHRVSVDYMREKIWPRMAPIIRAAEAGVRNANPRARFILHLTQWNVPDYCIAFWQYMVANRVQVDFAGLSYFPSSFAKEEERTFDFLQSQINRIYLALRKPALICESGYPCEANFGGQFAAWNHSAPGYPLDPTGQALWVRDYVRFLRRGAHLAGGFYWSPEWYGGGIWDAFALFDGQGRARPAFAALREVPPTARALTLHSVPAPAATEKLHVYFGNLHSHTAVSDGAGTPAEAYAFARDEAKLDFLALTDHNHLLGGKDATPAQRAAAYAGPGADAIIPAAEKATADGRFVALYGQEFSTMSQGNHVNVFDVPAAIDVPNGKFDALLEWLEKHLDSTGQTPIVQFNHPGLSFPPNLIARNEYGRDDFGDDAGWLARMGRVTPLIELLNGEPGAEDAAHRSPQIMENEFRMFLQRGFQLAPTGNQDNHHQQWGACTESRTAVLAPALTRRDLLGALRARHVYASEDRNLRLLATVNGQLCGEVLKAGGAVEAAIHFADPDEPAARYLIDVVAGEIGGAAAEVVATARRDRECAAGEFLALDGLPALPPGHFIYFRITQVSERGVDRVWTAPVWVE